MQWYEGLVHFVTHKSFELIGAQGESEASMTWPTVQLFVAFTQPSLEEMWEVFRKSAALLESAVFVDIDKQKSILNQLLLNFGLRQERFKQG